MNEINLISFVSGSTADMKIEDDAFFIIEKEVDTIGEQKKPGTGGRKV